MASERQIAANRANAARSTGPRSKRGRARSSTNAWRHGFSTRPNSPSSNIVDQIARHLTNHQDTLSQLYAREAAEAQAVLLQVRSARRALLQELITGHLRLIPLPIKERLASFARDLPDPDVSKAFLDAFPGRLPKFVSRAAREELSRQRTLQWLAGFDRYEERAMHRRQRALRELDKIKRSHSTKLDSGSQP